MTPKNVTPKEALLKECTWCVNVLKLKKCFSTICQLKNESITYLPKRILTHCLTCTPEHSLAGVKKCDGRIGTVGNKVCPLHPFRLGK